MSAALVPVALAVLAACGTTTTDDPSTLADANQPTTPAVAESATPRPTSAEETGGGTEQGGDRPANASGGDCAAYEDSDDWCTDGAGDYDCEGGSGDGPNYAPRDVRVVDPGTDPFGLDRDNDGEGCTERQPAEQPPPPPPPPADDTDPRFDTCADAIDAGYGPYRRGEPEYSWYRDADGDGVICE